MTPCGCFLMMVNILKSNLYKKFNFKPVSRKSLNIQKFARSELLGMTILEAILPLHLIALPQSFSLNYSMKESQSSVNQFGSGSLKNDLIRHLTVLNKFTYVTLTRIRLFIFIN